MSTDTYKHTWAHLIDTAYPSYPSYRLRQSPGVNFAHSTIFFLVCLSSLGSQHTFIIASQSSDL